MRLIHTLLFYIRQDHYAQDLAQAEDCLKSLSQSTYKEVVIYNQGCLSNEALHQLVGKYDLTYTLLGEGQNIGIVAGRQSCFEFIWAQCPDTAYISELHLDMIFPACWENSLIQYLREHDEPVISCGIIDRTGHCVNLPGPAHILPGKFEEWAPFLQRLRQDRIVPGFTHPCIHVCRTLQAVGGYDLTFLQGKQCFEDDSLLLSYFLYYGTRVSWHPKITYNSVIYHGVATQRAGAEDCMQNYLGLIRQYGFMGQKYLEILHSNTEQKRFFGNQHSFLADLFTNG